MKFTFVLALVTLLSIKVLAQNDVTLILNPVKGQLVEFETDHAKIHFTKIDFLKSFSDFKKSAFHDLEKDKQHIISEAFKRFEKNKNNVLLKLMPDVPVEEQDPLVYYIKIYGGAALLNAKEAAVFNKANNALQKEILQRQLIDSPEGAAYLYSFKDGTEFFVGEIYGEHTLMLEPDGN